jgi:hypothetical protein
MTEEDARKKYCPSVAISLILMAMITKASKLQNA